MSSYCLASMYVALEKLVSLMKSCETALFLLLNSSIAFCSSSSASHCTCVCSHSVVVFCEVVSYFLLYFFSLVQFLLCQGFVHRSICGTQHVDFFIYSADCLDALVVFCWIFSCSASDGQSLGSVEFCYYGFGFSLDAIFSCLGYLFSLSLVSFHIWIGIILCFLF